MATTYVPLATTTATGGETTISFTSISGFYTDLVLVSSLIATTPYEMFLQFNTDTGTNYSTIYMEGNGTAASSGRSTTSPNILVSFNSTTNPTPVTINIQNYANTTTNKTVLARSSAASASVLSYVGMWRNTAAITSIQLKLTGGRSFSAGATFSLYGIANAAIAGGAKATGGDTISTDGTYWYHAFRTSGTFTPNSTLSCDVLAIAGGGGGSTSNGYSGGGAGGLAYTTANSFSTAQTVTIGGGGASATAGTNTTIGSLTAAVGGGRGGAAGTAGGNGGSGGGGGDANAGGGPYAGGTATAGQGNAGGNGTAGFAQGGGGGGAGGAGNPGSAATPNGGAATTAYSSWGVATGTGVLVSSTRYFAGGGSAGTGGTVTGGGSQANTGNGGNWNQTGSSGVVIVRYPI